MIRKTCLTQIWICLAAMQRNVTSFSRKGVVERGDASVWTQSPLDKNRPPDPVIII